jgi:phage baseplate assembly protein gpV
VAPVESIRAEHLARCEQRPPSSVYALSQGDGALLTYAEAAAVAHVEPGTVRQWVSRGALPVVVLDGRRLVPEAPLLECERARRRSGRRRTTPRAWDAGAAPADVSH